MANITIKELDDELHKRIKIAAIHAGVTIRNWIESAFKTKLDTDEKRKPS